MVFSSVAASSGLAEQGKLKRIAITSKARFPGVEDLPTVGETLPGYSFEGYIPLLAPAGLPAEIAERIKEVKELGVQTSVVIGGGNIWRGLSAAHRGMDRTTADYMGMLATVINGLALKSALTQLGIETRVQSAIEMKNVAEPFILGRAIRHLELGRVVIFVAGTGNPYFSTDTTAALRASEIGADIILKATKVDGIYDRDPKLHPEAKRYERVSFTEALTKRLQVMDSTAFSLCMDNKIPILVFDMHQPTNVRDAVLGKQVGSLVTD